jgi:hypothetical protein
MLIWLEYIYIIITGVIRSAIDRIIFPIRFIGPPIVKSRPNKAGREKPHSA